MLTGHWTVFYCKRGFQNLRYDEGNLTPPHKVTRDALDPSIQRIECLVVTGLSHRSGGITPEPVRVLPDLGNQRLGIFRECFSDRNKGSAA